MRTYTGMDSWNMPFSQSHWSNIPIYNFTSQSVANFYFSSSAALRCSAFYFTEYFTPKSSITKVKLIGRLSFVHSTGVCLRDVIHKMPCIGKGNHVQLVLYMGVNTFPWLLAQKYICCASCTVDCTQLWVPVGLSISGSLYNMIYLCNYWGIFFMSMHMYCYLMSEMTLFTCSFIVVKSDMGVLTSAG